MYWRKKLYDELSVRSYPCLHKVAKTVARLFLAWAGGRTHTGCYEWESRR
jgi:hypothetical protein